MIKLQNIKQKMKENFLEYLLYLFIFLLPWQTRWIFHDSLVGGEIFEYGRMSIYGFDILLIVILLYCYIVKLVKNNKVIKVKNKTLDIRYWILNIKSQKLNIKCQMFFISLIFIGYCLLSIIWSDNKLISLYWGIRMLMGGGLFYLIQKINFSKIKLAVVIVTVGALQGLLGIWQFLNQSVWQTKWLGMAGQSAQDLGVSVVEFGIERWLRAYGSWSHPNIFGASLILSLLAIIYLIPKIKHKYHKMGLIFASSFIWLGILFSFSRASWLLSGIIFIGGLIYIFKIAEGWVKKFAVYLWIYILILLIVFTFFCWPIVKTRLNIGESTRLEVMSITERLNGYQQAGEIIKSNWLVGTGIGNYVFELQDVYTNVYTDVYTLQAVHNISVLILAELGVLGLVIILLLNCYLVIVLIKRRQWSYLGLLFILYVLMLFDHWWWTTASGMYILWVIMGLGVKQINLDKNWYK